MQEIPLTLFAGEEQKLTSRITVKNPKPWSDETPTLYQVKSILYEADMVLDENTERFGIRKLSLDAVPRTARKWKFRKTEGRMYPP